MTPEKFSAEATIKIENKRYLKLSGKEILEKEIKYERLEQVPVEFLSLDESIVDDEHVRVLEDSISGPRGQLSPLVVRARLTESNEIAYDIIDGFHRGTALKRLGVEFADCKVVYGCDDEEFYDLRVTAALSVSSVSFPRIAKWMKLSYEQTDYAKSGLTLLQAISLANQDTSGVRFGSMLSAEDVGSVKKWVVDKARKWKKNPSMLYQDMLAIDQAAPDIVEKVRLGEGGGHEGQGAFNPARFKAMVSQLPGDFDLQRVVFELIKQFNLDQFEVAKVARAMKEARGDPMTVQMLKKDPLAIAEGLLAGLENEPENNETTRKRNHSSRKTYTPKPGVGYIKKDTPDQIMRENERLKLALATVNEKKEKKRGGSGNPLWFMTIPDMPFIERQAMEMAFGENSRSIDDIAGILNLTPNKVIQLLISGHTRYWLSRKERRLNETIKSLKLK